MNRRQPIRGRARGGQVAPVSKQRPVRPPPVRVTRAGEWTVVTHRELFAALQPGGPRTVAVSATNFEMFPWLATMAPMFESYCVRELRVEYETMQATTVPGAIYMAFDYDPSDPGSRSKTEIMGSQGAVRMPIWQPGTIRFDPSRMRNRTLYTRGDEANARFDTAASFNYLVETGANDPGELYVCYTIAFKTPQLVRTTQPNYCLLRPTNDDLVLPASGADWFANSSFLGNKIEAHQTDNGFNLQSVVSGTYELILGGSEDVGFTNWAQMIGANGVYIDSTFVTASSSANKNARYLVWFPERGRPITTDVGNQPALQFRAGSGTVTAFVLALNLLSRYKSFPGTDTRYRMFAASPS